MAVCLRSGPFSDAMALILFLLSAADAENVFRGIIRRIGVTNGAETRLRCAGRVRPSSRPTTARRYRSCSRRRWRGTVEGEEYEMGKAA